MKFVLLLVGFGTTTGQSEWEFANKLENPNLSGNMKDIVSASTMLKMYSYRTDFFEKMYYRQFSLDQHRKNIS